MESDRVKLLYKGHQILNVIFGILFGSLAVLRWYRGKVEFEGTAILICLAESSMLVLVCVLPQFIIRRYFVSRNGRGGIGLEAYVWTGAMVLDDYAALLMINIENAIVVIVPAMILVFIGTLGLEQMKSGTVEFGTRQKDHGVNPLTTEKQDNNEDILSVQKIKSSDKLELFEFVSYLLQLSSVTWTQYKGQQGSTPGLSDFLLFLCSALGALGVMLSSSLAGVNSREITVQVLPVLHKTCAVVLFIAVQTLAAECLGGDIIYVSLPELITVFLWFTICFGKSMSITSFTSVKSQVIIVSSVVFMLACLFSWNTNDSNTRGTWIIWSFWISISSPSFSQLHIWLLQDWPGSSSESTKLIPLLHVSSTICYDIAALLCAYIIVTEPRIVYEAIYSFEHKAMAAVGTMISLFILLVWSARYCPGHPFGHTANSTEISIAVQRIPDKQPYRDLEQESKVIVLEEKPDEHNFLDEDERMASTWRESSISGEQPARAYVEFNCDSDDYGAFMDEVREKLADHPDKAEVHGRPVLAKRQVAGLPNRWMHIKLVGNKDETTTLAVLDDSVYLIGFQDKKGKWYEFGFDAKWNSEHILKKSTFLGCDVAYGSLLFCSDHEAGLGQLKLGKKSALEAISILSGYKQRKGKQADQHTRKALARLMVMICESARLAPIYKTVKKGWDEGSVISVQHARYIHNWAKMSACLMGRRIKDSRLCNIGIVDENDAAEVVHLVLNNTLPLPIRRQLEPVPAVVNGRFMLEVLFVKANYLVVGTITFIDGKGGRIIIFTYPIKGATRSSQSDGLVSVRTTSTAPSGDVSANNSFSVKVNHEAGLDEYCSDGDDNFTDESKSVSSSTITTDSADDAQSDHELDGSTVIKIPYNQGETDSVISSTHTTMEGQIYMYYALLSNAVQATVQVKLKPKGVLTPDATIRVYGEITAQCNCGNIVLLSKLQEDREMQVDVLQTSDGIISIPIPLTRSVFAVTVGSRIILKVRLHVACSSYDKAISFEDDDRLAFPHFGKRPKLKRKIDGPGMVAQVVVTAS